ncbi:unnamed protein product [Rodentolepis nana]|uniref:Uncharacterized protein n=1 Tax=Rodentolepis nana TaxID=102285 RepID=A0A0R3T6R9_RODNA|nr:unnamed protein product [Rodentolepis nana]
MSTYQQLYVPPVRLRKSCCDECSLCYCWCCLSISIILAIIFTVAGGLLVYNFRKERFDDFKEWIGIPEPPDNEFLRVLGYILIILGCIMVISVFISASCVCCLSSPPVHQPGVVVVNVSVNKSSSILSSQQPADVTSSSLAPISPPTAPIEPPPSYESISQEKI